MQEIVDACEVTLGRGLTPLRLPLFRIGSKLGKNYVRDLIVYWLASCETECVSYTWFEIQPPTKLNYENSIDSYTPCKGLVRSGDAARTVHASFLQYHFVLVKVTQAAVRSCVVRTCFLLWTLVTGLQ